MKLVLVNAVNLYFTHWTITTWLHHELSCD